MDIVIDLEQLDTIISSLNSNINNIKATNDEMTSHIKDVLDNNWDSIVKEKMLSYYSNVQKITH